MTRPGRQAAHGVGGDALGGVDGGGVAESVDCGHSRREANGEAAAGVSHGEVARWPMRVMVHRSPFLTQSVAVRRSRRSLVRVMITSPTRPGSRRPRPPRVPRRSDRDDAPWHGG